MKTRKGTKTSADNVSANKYNNHDPRQSEAVINETLTEVVNKPDKAGLYAESHGTRSIETNNITPTRSSQRLKRKSQEISETQNNVAVSGKEILQNGKGKKKFKSVSTETITTKNQLKTSLVKSSKTKNEPKNSKGKKYENQNENLLNENGQNKEYLNFIKEQIQSCSLINREKDIDDIIQDKCEESTEIRGTTERSDHTYQLMKKKEKVNVENHIKEQEVLSVSESHPDTKLQESVTDVSLGREAVISSDNTEGSTTEETNIKYTGSQYEHDVELSTQKYNSLLENVDFGTLLTSVGSMETKSASKSLPIEDVRTSTAEEVGVPCNDKDVYTPEMVGLEIKDDMIFGPVSAVIKPACENFIGIVKDTGVRIINKDNNYTLLQGSLKSLIRAEAVLKEKLHAVNNCSQKMSTEDNVNTVVKNNEVEIPKNLVEVSQTQGIHEFTQTSQVSQMSDTMSEQQVKKTVVMTTSVADDDSGEVKEVSFGNVKEFDTNEQKASLTNLFTCTRMENKHSLDQNENKETDMKKSSGSTDKLIATHDVKESQNAVRTEKEQFETQYNCKKCNRNFWTQDLLQTHKDKKHGPNICQLCGKEFAFKRYLHMHMKRHANVRKFECEFCGWKFLERYKLKLHLESHKHFNERNLPYKCDVCDKQFYNKAGLSDHMNTHTGDRPFKCNQCDASFAHRIGLRRHEVVHSKNKPFVCQHCSKAFPFKSKLDAHLTMHTGVSKYSCQLCGKVYTVSSSLKRHMETCQGKDTMVVKAEELDQSTIDMINATVADPEAVYMCGICGSLFNSLEKASSHTATHETTNNETQPGQLADTVAYHEIVSGQIDPVETQTSCQVIEMTDITNL